MKEIGDILGIHPDTIQRWLRDGKKAKSGIKRQLFEAVETAKAELISELSEVVFDAAFIGGEIVTEKEIRLPDGTSRVEVTRKRTPPSASYALKVLAIMDPGRWGQVQQIKVDWRMPIRELGLDVMQVEQAFFSHLNKNQEEVGNVTIPLSEHKLN